jgi:uncharacterized protein YdeI (YjbR/CyaY-like superfamily)
VSAQGLPVLAFGSAAEWEAWLESEHATSDGIWLKVGKKTAPEPSVSYAEALEVALCFGWIDGQKRGFDEEYWLQRFTPRKPGSKWSKINTEKTDALIAAGRMRPAGQRQADTARADGRWDAAYAGQRTSTVPDDLRAALDANPAAADFFATISSANRYAIIYRIGSVKRPQTRARKIAQYVQMLAEHQTIHP